MYLTLPLWHARPCVVRKRKGTICFFIAITMVDFGSWFHIGLVLLRFYMVIYSHMLPNFVLLEVSQKTLGHALLLFGFRFYSSFWKIETGEFFRINLIILKLFLKGLNFKHIGGWKRTTSCSILTIPIGGKTLSLSTDCFVMSGSVFFLLYLALLYCN